jgi:hypothetical protein
MAKYRADMDTNAKSCSTLIYIGLPISLEYLFVFALKMEKPSIICSENVTNQF